MKQPFSELLNSETPTLVDFYTEWCGPCKRMKPILEELKSKVGTKAMIVKLDVETNPKIADRYHVQSVPTLAIFKRGEIVWRQSGVVSADYLHSILQQHFQ